MSCPKPMPMPSQASATIARKKFRSHECAGAKGLRLSIIGENQGVGLRPDHGLGCWVVADSTRDSLAIYFLPDLPNRGTQPFRKQVSGNRRGPSLLQFLRLCRTFRLLGFTFHSSCSQK